MLKKLLKVCSIAVVFIYLGSNQVKADSLTDGLSNGNLSSLGQQLIQDYTSNLSSQNFYQTLAPQYYQGAQYLQNAGQSLGSGLNLNNIASGNFNLQGILQGGVGSIFSQAGNLQGIISQLSNGNLASLATTSQISQAPMTLLSFASPTLANSLMNMQQQATKIYSSGLTSYQSYVNKSSLGNGIVSQGVANSMVSCIQQNTSSGMDLTTALDKCSQSQLTPQYVPLTANSNNQLTSNMNVTQESAQLGNLDSTSQNIYQYYVGNISINNGQVQADVKQNPILSAYDDYSKYYGSLIVGAINNVEDSNTVSNNLQQIAYQTGITITPDLIIKLHNSPNGTLYANQLGSQIAIERIKKDMALVNSTLGVSIQKAKEQGNVALAGLLMQRQETLNKQFSQYQRQDVNYNIAQISNAVYQENAQTTQQAIASGMPQMSQARGMLNPNLTATTDSSSQSVGQNVIDAINNSVQGLISSQQNNSTYQNTLSAVQKWNQ
ncbi:MAG: hypothetical protein QXI16_02445 [Sulfolobaceae archaeon]